jgi:hypothetical protein
MVTSLVLIGALALPSYNYRTTKPLNNRQVRARAMLVVQKLKKLNPKVLRSVMYYMDWVPKMEYTRQKCKKNNNIKTTEDPVMDMLLNEAGIKLRNRR